MLWTATSTHSGSTTIRHFGGPRMVLRAGGKRQAAAMFRQALPDWHSDVEELVAEGDLVVERFTASGTHTGELMGVPPTGKVISLRGMQMFRIDGDKIVERWGRLDEAGLLRQLGLIPA